MKEDIKAYAIVVLLIIVALGFALFVVAERTPRCIEKYGEGSRGHIGHQGSPHCILPDGSGRYL